MRKINFSCRDERIIRPLTDEEKADNKESVGHYMGLMNG